MAYRRSSGYTPGSLDALLRRGLLDPYVPLVAARDGERQGHKSALWPEILEGCDPAPAIVLLPIPQIVLLAFPDLM